ncbi:hypothetical protein EI555_010895 [Monodon monoceros]|uniref:Uncharacterized protein n=1 Tax=Monodon monoceros TaxID=40151 RepID=A0A4U1FAG6_MONMO|nr:hypothetical protein EI555_010895 [Monodon monoceros]
MLEMSYENHYNFTKWYYEQDQAAHLWRAEGDYLALMEVINKLRKKKSRMLEFSEA